MGIGTHKNDALVCLNDFAFTNALVKQGSRRDCFRRRKRIDDDGEKEVKKNEERMHKIRSDKYAQKSSTKETACAL